MADAFISQLRTGDNAAWEQVYDLLAGDVRAYVSRLGSREPDDIVGETMVQLVRDISRFTGTSHELRPWAFRIAHNRVIDAARRRGARPTEVQVDPSSESLVTPAPLTESPDLDRLSELLDGLTIDQREVVWLRFGADMSLDDTATILGKSPDAVAALTHRALRTLRASLSH